MTSTLISSASSQDTQLVTRFIQAVWADARPDLLEQFVSADFVDHAYAPPDQTGHGAMVRLFADAFGPASHAIDQCVAQDGLVMVRLRVRGRHAGTFRDIPASCNEIDVAQYRTFRVVDGKIAEHWALFDTAGLLRQLQPGVVVAGGCAAK